MTALQVALCNSAHYVAHACCTCGLLFLWRNKNVGARTWVGLYSRFVVSST